MEVTNPTDNDLQAQILQVTLREISQEQQEKHPQDGEDAGDTIVCCVICLDAVTEPCVARPCGHNNFDFLCLASWLEKNPACPLCKASVKETSYGDSIDQDPSEWKIFTVPPVRTNERHSRSLNASGQSSFASAPARTRQRRRRASPPRTSAEDEALQRRRHVYANSLYSLHVGSNRRQNPRYREITPQLLATDPAQASRARKWIRRELRVFEFLSTSLGPLQISDKGSHHPRRRPRRVGNNAEFLLEYIMAIIKTVDMRGAHGQAEDMLSEFLGRDSARLFLHELGAWLRSPFQSLEEWDKIVQYDESRVRAKEPGFVP